MEVARSAGVAKAVLLVQILFLVRHFLHGGSVGKGPVQIARLVMSVEVEAGMGYPRILID